MVAYQYSSKSTRLTNYSVIPNDLFAFGLSSTATVLYSKLFNRANLSIANGRVDEKGRIFILYRQEDLACELGKSISAVKINLNELVESGGVWTNSPMTLLLTGTTIITSKNLLTPYNIGHSIMREGVINDKNIY